MNYKLLYRVFTYKVSSEEAVLNVPLSILKITFPLRSLERFRKIKKVKQLPIDGGLKFEIWRFWFMGWL